MPLIADDIVFYKSGAGLSEGGAITATEIVSGASNNLWADISDVLRTAGSTRYRKFYIANESSTDDMVEPNIWISTSPAGVTCSIGVGLASTDDADSAQGNMTAFTATAVVSVASDGGDTRGFTVRGLDGSGTPVTETGTLNGTTQVLTSATFSKVYSVSLDALSGTRSVTVKQASGGTTRGTIGVNKVVCWLWVNATSKATAIKLTDLAQGTSIPVWSRQVWPAGTASQKPSGQTVAIEES